MVQYTVCEGGDWGRRRERFAIWQAQDLRLHLERNWGIKVPGYTEVRETEIETEIETETERDRKIGGKSDLDRK